jgi:DNA-binding phage protein
MTDEQLAAPLRAFRRAEKALEDRRLELFEAIGQAVVERGVRQSEVARQTGYTREHVRRICNAYIDRRDGKTDTLRIARSASGA